MSRRKSSRYNKSSPSTDNNNSNLSPNTNSGKKKKKRISKKQREENARANQIKNEFLSNAQCLDSNIYQTFKII